MLIFLYITLLDVTILVTMFLFLKFLKISNKEMFDGITNFESYMAILTYHMEKAYDIVYKEKIMVYSLESMRLSEDQYNITSKHYTNLVLKMIGPNVKTALTTLYGDEETLLFNILEYFGSKYERDEIYKNSSEELMLGEDRKNPFVNTRV